MFLSLQCCQLRGRAAVWRPHRHSSYLTTTSYLSKSASHTSLEVTGHPGGQTHHCSRTSRGVRLFPARGGGELNHQSRGHQLNIDLLLGSSASFTGHLLDTSAPLFSNLTRPMFITSHLPKLMIHFTFTNCVRLQIRLYQRRGVLSLVHSLWEAVGSL